MRARRILVALVALFAGVVPVAGAPGVACAAEGPRAVLVVDTGESVHRYCVALGKEKVSGLEVIKLAGTQHGLDYALGQGGAAVCRLARVGPDGSDCFADYPDFWGYWRGDGSGGWTWSSAGAGSTTVADGSVEGWSWGSGDSGATHPVPPATDFSSVCPKSKPPAAGKPAESKAPAPTPAPVSSPASSATEEEGVTGDGERAERKGRKERKERKERRERREREDGRDAVAAVASPAPPETMVPATAPAGAEEGPPAAGIVALAAAGLLGVVGGLVARRRRRPSSESE